MSVRKKYEQRCERCRMRRELCLCSEISPLQLATKVVLVAARRELQVPTNTGRLAAQMLTNSVVLTRGALNQPCDLQPHLPPGGKALLLYPSDDALELTPDLAAAGPYTLVVLDGNWRQTSKMRRREPLLAALPTVTLPAGPPSAYGVRKETKAHGLATIEAVARALAILEGEEARRSLERIFALMVQRTLASRGLHAKLGA